VFAIRHDGMMPWKSSKNPLGKIQMDPDPTIHSLLNKPWELWLENEKISTDMKQ